MRLAILVALITVGLAGSASAVEPYSIYNTSTGEVSIHNLRGFDSLAFLGLRSERDSYFPYNYVTSPPASYLKPYSIPPDMLLMFPSDGETVFNFDSVTFNRVFTDNANLNAFGIGVGGYFLTPRYIPEPSSLCIAGTGLAMLAGLRRRRVPSDSQAA